MKNVKSQRDGKTAATGNSDGRATRRSFLARIGLTATMLGLAGQAFAFFRSLVPNVLYEAPQRFKIGTPDQFGEGSKFLEDKREPVNLKRRWNFVAPAMDPNTTVTAPTMRGRRLGRWPATNSKSRRKTGN
jgi:hypothetical protein